MIAGIFYKGSGLGNQLARYVMVRTIAADKGYEFGMVFPQDFKGSSFMNLDMGVPVKGLLYEFDEARELNQFGQDVRDYDPKVKDIKDFTLVDGEFQGEKYYQHRLNDIREWLKLTKPNIYKDPRTCVINFRGGEYVGVRDLFLPKEYWDRAIAEMRKIEPDMKFEVHTDDAETARKFFPDFPIIQDMYQNWVAVNSATYLILSNSSFAILPALLNRYQKKIIAPRFWAGYNKGYWQQKQCRYERFAYL